MSPLEIRVLLAHYVSPEPGQFFSNGENWRMVLPTLEALELLKITANGHVTTKRGEHYAESLQAVPLPEYRTPWEECYDETVSRWTRR